MDKLTQYRTYIKQLICHYASPPPVNAETLEMQTVFDTEHDHYQLMMVGWENDQRIHSCPLHLDLKDHKIWIQQNNTDRRIAYELVEMGVPKEDIVLGFHPPYRRQFTEFAAG